MSALFRATTEGEPDGGGGRRLLGASVVVLGLIGLGWFGWSWSAPPERCATPEERLTGSLSCAELLPLVRYAELLAARRLPPDERLRIYDELHTADEATLRADLAAASAVVEQVRALVGLEAARARSERTWELSEGGGPFPRDRYPRTAEVVVRLIAPWSVDAAQRLVLSEMDVEGWIRYASLCREAQGGGPVSASVASRVQIYGAITERFEELDREGKIAMTAVGPFWTSVKLAWQAAPYERQQAWIAAAPLPPPMTATSFAYIAEVVGGDVVRHASTLHEQLGPLDLDVAR